MEFLADESCDFAVVRAVRAAGFTVRAVGEIKGGAADEEVLALAIRDGLVLLTEDKDFGRLFLAHTGARCGVVLIRFPAAARALLGARATELLRGHAEELRGALVVLEPARVRLRRPS